MPINFDLRPFANVSHCFCETGTYKGSSVIKALEAGFSKIATIEISDENLLEAKSRIKTHPSSSAAHIEYILGDAEDKLADLINFAQEAGTDHPVFWLDAHTHVFEDGTLTGGNPCPLLTEISEIKKPLKGVLFC